VCFVCEFCVFVDCWCLFAMMLVVFCVYFWCLTCSSCFCSCVCCQMRVRVRCVCMSAWLLLLGLRFAGG